MKTQCLNIVEDLTAYERDIEDFRTTNNVSVRKIEDLGATLESILWVVFRALDGKFHKFDDLLTEECEIDDDKIVLSGTCYFLDRKALWRADIARKTTPVLYSFKFFDTKSHSQFLYVARQPTHWEFARS